MSKKILKQLGIILALCLVAETVASLLPVTIPSSVIAILILALLLGVKVLKEEQIKETADFMLDNMALVFVPISVGMIEDLELLKGQVLGFLIVVCISLILTFLGTYASVRVIQICMKKITERGGRKNG
ncbi:MAG: CidA/LrgA family protein [Dorea sp.]|nr:CidA/LrgA family protein [Dorea sp.]MDY2813512.1 CidA/LrgA family protein [Dorea sp.]